jgi:micrococcal nuclease
MYEYRTRVVGVVDGDTLDAEIDLGLDVRHRIRLRIEGVDSPELSTPEGRAAQAYVRGWLENHGGLENLVVVRTIKDRREKYGRYLARVYGWSSSTPREERVRGMADRCLNEMLVAEGHATPYAGGAR